MDNPVVVFFDGARPELGNGTRFWPIGWMEGGEMHKPLRPNTGYDVLMLNDNDPTIPESTHTNKNLGKALLVVAHNGSMHHTNPTTNDRLNTWGLPYVCERFSHLPTDDIFKEILLLLGDFTHAAGFAKKRRDKDQLAACDGLAAICQIIR